MMILYKYFISLKNNDINRDLTIPLENMKTKTFIRLLSPLSHDFLYISLSR